MRVLVDFRTPVGQLPWRMMFQHCAELHGRERDRLNRRPAGWVVWLVVVLGVAAWPVAFAVSG